MNRSGGLRRTKRAAVPMTKVLPRRPPAGSSTIVVVHPQLPRVVDEELMRSLPLEVRAAVDSHFLRPAPKPVPAVRDEAFLSLVRTKACLVPWCHAEPPNDPAHTGPRGIRQKTDDLRCVPACRRCHRFFDVNHYLPLDGPRTVPLHRAPGPVVRRLKLWTRLLVAETQRELLVEYIRERAA